MKEQSDLFVCSLSIINHFGAQGIGCTCLLKTVIYGQAGSTPRLALLVSQRIVHFITFTREILILDRLS